MNRRDDLRDYGKNYIREFKLDHMSDYIRDYIRDVLSDIFGARCPGRQWEPLHGGERKAPHLRADGLAPVGSADLRNRGDSIVVR